MKADLTRNTFDPLKHFTRVLMQQGRVQLDADWNEQAAILLRYLQTLGADIIGPAGGPADHWGFGVAPVAFTPAVQNDFRIGLGSYYVDGILCEADSTPVAFSVKSAAGNTNTATVQVDQWTLDGAPFQANQLVEAFDDVQLPGAKPAFQPTVVEVTNPQHTELTLTLQAGSGTSLPSFSSATSPKLRRVITYLTQPDYPVPENEKLAANTKYLVYLDVWEMIRSGKWRSAGRIPRPALKRCGRSKRLRERPGHRGAPRPAGTGKVPVIIFLPRTRLF